MFEEQATGDLRQGDICFGVETPVVNLNEVRISARLGQSASEMTVPLFQGGKCRSFAVLSHDCDLENAKSGQQGGIIVAPVYRVPLKAEHDLFATVCGSGMADPDSSEYDFINWFPIDLPMITLDTVGTGWHVIDFSLLFNMGPAKGVKKMVGGMKHLEMIAETRRALADKLAAFFARSQEPR